MLEVRRTIRSEKERLGMRGKVKSKRTIRGEIAVRSEKTIKGLLNLLELSLVVYDAASACGGLLPNLPFLWLDGSSLKRALLIGTSFFGGAIAGVPVTVDSGSIFGLFVAVFVLVPVN
nr:hypothetical protein [Tanacetum cinerariifolium]